MFSHIENSGGLSGSHRHQGGIQLSSSRHRWKRVGLIVSSGSGCEEFPSLAESGDDGCFSEPFNPPLIALQVPSLGEAQGKKYKIHLDLLKAQD